MPLYRIKDWNENYETHRTRDLAQMKWVPIPNKMDGIGYTELIEHPNGAAHFGAWIAIIEIASRQDPRGTLPTVRGSTCIALSRLSRIPVQVFEEVMPRLLAEEIGWIEEVAAEDRANAAQTSRSVAQDGEKPALYNSTVQDIEEKGIQGTENTARAPELSPKAKPSELGIEGWDELIEAATKAGMSLDPSPTGDLCQKIWRYRDFERRQQLIQGILDRTASGQYSPEERQFTPTLANYLGKNLDRETLRPRNRGQPNGRRSADELNQRGIERAIKEAKERKETKWKTTTPHLT